LLAAKQQPVIDIVQQHWQQFGRNAYARHDYEEVENDGANSLMDALHTKFDGLTGKSLGNFTVKYADDFSYTDPIDHSTSNHQGLRIGFDDGSRIVFRLSGTGTKGATLRIYLEAYSQKEADFSADAHELLKPLAKIASETARITHFTGRDKPTVIT
jgi:phosphoglucomutase